MFRLDNENCSSPVEQPTTITIDETELKFLSLNVCGIKSKLNYPEFLTLIKSYDIIGIQETKTDDLDTTEITGYKVFLNNRSCISKNRSGGIALIVKEWILPFDKVHDTKLTDLAIVFTLSKILCREGSSAALKGAVIYIPPYGSKYASEDPFLEIQEAMLRFSSNSSNSDIIIFGDFNARSSNLPDYVELDFHISDSNGLQEVYEENVTILMYSETFNVPLNRNTADPNTNMYGNTMLEFCKNHNSFILNGRVGQDYITPKLTCKEKSTVDYFLASACTFEHIKDFQVEEFICLVSDAHCAVTLKLNLQWDSNVEKRALREENVKTIFWQSDKSDDFIENFDIMKVAEIENYLEHLIETNNIEETQVNQDQDTLLVKRRNDNHQDL